MAAQTSVGRFTQLLCLVLSVSSASAGPDISYFMSKASQQNCVELCGSHGLVCAQSGGFPLGDASGIFDSLGFTCKNNTSPDAATYVYPDQPCYMATGSWQGQCVGFKNIPHTIDCVTANNTDIRRLCPCRQPTVPTPHGITSECSSTTEEPGVTSSSTQSREITEAQRLNDSERTRDSSATVTAVTVVTVGMALACLAGIGWKWRKYRFRNKRKQNGECSSGKQEANAYQISPISGYSIKPGQNNNCSSGKGAANVYDTPTVSRHSLARSKSQENLIYESMETGGDGFLGEEDCAGSNASPEKRTTHVLHDEAEYEQMAVYV